jgi:CysZ protein
VLKEIILAIQAYIKAHEFIRANKLWKWIIIPGILYMTMFMVSMYYFGKTANAFNEWLSLKTGLKAWLDTTNTGWIGFLFTLGGLFLWLVQMMLYFSLFKYLWLIIGSPVFAYLSEKTASIMEGRDYPFSLTQLLKDMIRGIRLAARNALWQTVYLISLLIVSLIPIVGWLTPALVVLIECYYYGFSMLDYSMERHKKSAGESIAYVSAHKGLAIGNGIIFYFMHLIPFIGWVFAPAYAVVAATLSLYPLNQKQQPTYVNR